MFVIEVPFFNLDQIYASGQGPRWIKLKDMKYVIPHGSKALKIEQKNARLMISGNDDDFYDIWYHYLDLGTDYREINYRMKKECSGFIELANECSGVHVIKPEPFESYVFSKLIQYTGWEKAKRLMNRIAKDYGIVHSQTMREAGKIKWYEWPMPEALLEKLMKEWSPQMPKVKRFLVKLCDAIVNEGYDYEQNGNDLFRLLCKHDLKTFPTTGIEKVIEKDFRSDVDWFETEYLYDVKYRGVCFVYMLHRALNERRTKLWA